MKENEAAKLCLACGCAMVNIGKTGLPIWVCTECVERAIQAAVHPAAKK